MWTEPNQYFKWNFSIMHFCSQMTGFMDGSELWRVIERQFEEELTFNGRRVGSRPRDPPLLNYLARCHSIVSAQKKLQYSKGLPSRLYLTSHSGNVSPTKRIISGTDSFSSVFSYLGCFLLAARPLSARDAAARTSSRCSRYPQPDLSWISSRRFFVYLFCFLFCFCFF